MDGAEEVNDEDEIGENENPYLMLQPGRVIEGQQKINFQQLQKNSMMLEILGLTRGEGNIYDTNRAVNIWRQQYGENFPPPNKKTFDRLLDTFRRYKACAIPKRPRCSVRQEALTRRVDRSLRQNSTQSLRGLALRIGGDREVIRKLVRNRLTRRPYRTHKVQKLHEADFPIRLQHGQFLLQQNQEVQEFLRHVFFTDESIFTQAGTINKQNVRHWDVRFENEPVLREIEHQRRWKIMVWAGIINDRLIGPFFLEGNLNGPAYTLFLRRYLPRMIERSGLRADQIWWQQDGAPCHNAARATRYLNRIFRNHWFGTRGPRRYPPRSPDLTPLDFFLWGHIKNIVYKEAPTTLVDMKRRIRRAFRTINGQMLRNVRLNLARRVNCVVEVQGDHVEPIIN